MNPADRNYDFIVCGAGTAGCVVAARLADQRNARVLLLEAGDAYTGPEIVEPALWPLNLGSERDWAFEGQPNPHLNGRRLSLNMGKGLGGGSSINVMVWARGHRSDWDHFAAQAGDPAWGYDSVLGYYRRIENWQGAPDAARRGSGGPVHIEPPRRAAAACPGNPGGGKPVGHTPVRQPQRRNDGRPRRRRANRSSHQARPARVDV